MTSTTKENTLLEASETIRARIYSDLGALARNYAESKGVPVKRIHPILMMVDIEAEDVDRWYGIDEDGLITAFDEEPQEFKDCWDVPDGVTELYPALKVLNWEDLLIKVESKK